MKTDSRLLAIVLTVAAAFVLAAMDSLGKILMQSFATPQVTWARFFFHAVFVAAIFLAQGHRDFLLPKAPKIQLLRGLCIIGVTTSMYISIQSVSLAEATAFLYLSPVIVTLLAGVLLGETVRPSHLFGVMLGFAGILFVVKPGFREFQPSMLLAFCAAVLLAFYFLLTSKAARYDHPRTSLFYASIVGAVILSILQPFYWKAPSTGQWLLFLTMGALGASGHFMLIKAYSLAPASILSPWLYAQVIGATLYSIVIFDDVLDWSFFTGAAFIIAAGLFIWSRERLLAVSRQKRATS